MQMNMNYMETKGLDSRLIDVTVGEALELAKPFLRELITQVVSNNLGGKGADEFGHGLKAIQEIFGCSPAKAVKIHHDKRFAPAFLESGKKIIVNKTLLYKIMQEEKMKQLRLR